MSKPYFVSPAEGRVTSPYGPRPPLPYHYGIDIAPPIPGTKNWPVYAAYGGTVVAVNDGSRPNDITGTWNTGSYVKIDGPGGGSEWYGHLETIDVRAGDKVEAGDKLGTMGARGNVTGIHLHFETWDSHVRSPHNPMIDFNKHGVRPGSKPQRTGTVSRPSSGGNHVISSAEIRRRIGSRSVKNYQDGQLYAPGLIADGVWGPATEAHYRWVLRLQRAMENWKGSVRPARDGDFGRVTQRRVWEIQRRNHGGTYRGTLESIPGPVFCAMLGLPSSPGL